MECTTDLRNIEDSVLFVPNFVSLGTLERKRGSPIVRETPDGARGIARPAVNLYFFFCG